MTRHRTFRVIATTTGLTSIDLSARSEAIALMRAEKLWDGGMHSRFERNNLPKPTTFAIDEHASLHLRNIVNDDRARWAKKALHAFSQETGLSMGEEALHDLLCDLGHYARSIGLDVHEEMGRAAAVCDVEVEEEAQS